MLYNLKVNEKWLNYIIAGTKTIEGRLNKNKFRLITRGDIILFNGIIQKKVVGVRHYDGWDEYLETEGINKCLPSIKTIRDGIVIYRDFYNVADECLYGVVAFELGDCVCDCDCHWDCDCD